MPQNATTGNLANAQNTIIGAARYTQEMNAPSWQLIEKIQLPKGASTYTVPKVGRFEISDLVDGQDMVDEQAIGMTTTDLTATERGAKIIVTDKLVRQNGTTPIFQMIGRQFGDAAARKQDRDTQALYSGLNGGTVYGEASAAFTLSVFSKMIAKAKGGAVGTGSSADTLKPEAFIPTYAVHHPHATYNVARSASTIGNNNIRVGDAMDNKLLANFWTGIKFGGVSLYESGNINVDSSGDGIGVIAQKDALVGLTSVNWRTERERDASRRAWELNHVADYGVFELDDAHGAPVLVAADAPSDSV